MIQSIGVLGFIWWTNALVTLRWADDSLDVSLREPLANVRQGFSKQTLSGYHENSIDADYFKRLKSIREQTKTPSDG